MRELVYSAVSYWRPALIAAGCVFGLWQTPNSYKDVTQELIALFGLMMAGVLPTMVLTANVLRAGNLSVQKIDSYHTALVQQMQLWIGLFIVSLTASLSVVVGKLFSWTIPLNICPLTACGDDYTIELVRILNSTIAGCLVLTFIRGQAVGVGVMSLLRLSADIARGEAVARESAKAQGVQNTLRSLPERPGYGQYVEAPNGP